ncbi:SusC/RagA family TonB-linked outer membrane protein [Spirosoma utsteinense]|uniref:TonB-linked SusC/RagA family outer membrane protein n=1 Tax=Spirosoma utsteinense TaxID=2585773 RepID=A0ABR6W4Y1_9BACT|nr:TonB-dependent receptor [Spirosoma utsteinense]MBC3791036.1 TonB-linked SusC/RagA family outer membrane protein [Spirosoma utsteinense]
MRKLLLGSWLLILLFCLPALAQDVAVSGRVTSSDDGSALPGVSVQVKGTTRGATTDANGNYRVSASANSRLVFSFIGFSSQEVAIGNRSTVNITLQADATNLGEVVVTGYGGTVNRREFTGASSKVSGAAVSNLPVGSFDKALAGRAAGVQVTSANGVPGGAIQIRIRGVGSISAGSDPLYVVDGVQLNTSNNSSFTSSNPLSFLNPSDIESIEILKDAAAASIYGSQAANGVVLVTTKRGKAGKTQITFNYFKGIADPIKQLDVLNTQEWIQLRTENLVNAGTAADVARSSVLSTLRLPTSLTDADIAALPTYDWQKAAFRQGQTDNYEIGMNGGNEKTRFYVSGSYYTQSANVINVNFKRGTLNSTLTHQINSKLSIDQTLKLSTITSNGQFGGPNGGSFLGAAAFSSPLILPSVAIYNADGSYNGTPALGGIPGILNQNIIQVSELNTIRADINQFVGSLALNYKVTDNLTIRPFVSLDYRSVRGRNFSDPRTADGINVRGRVQDQFNENKNFLTNVTANYNKEIGKSDFGLLLGAEYRSDINENLLTNITNVPTPDFKYASAAALPVSIGGTWTGYRKGSVFGNLKYNFNKKYDLSLIGRLDGSSRFGANNRFGFFPSISGAWLISEESFLKGGRYVSDLKLRASFGTTGNDQLGSLFNAANFPGLGLVNPGFDYNGAAGFAPSQLANPDLKWETNQTANIGLDFGFFGNRITGSVDVFQRTSKDLLLPFNLPFTSGYSSISRNAGEVQNRGLEVELNTVNVRAGQFQWKSSFNITTIQNKVTKLYPGIVPLNNPDSTILLTYTDFYGVGRNAILGRPLQPQYTTDYAGVNPATGRAMFYDYAGNITYRPLIPRDQKYFGTELPKFYGGFNNTIVYGGLSLDFLIQFDYGRRSFNTQTSFLAENAGRNFNALQSTYDRRWQKAGDITDVPRAYNANVEPNSVSGLGGTRTLEDASYLRLKQITLNYDVPAAISSRIKASKARIYIQAANLITVTKWTSYDPEFLNFGSGNSGLVPNSKTYQAGVNVTF